MPPESLVHDGKLRDDVDFNAVVLGLKVCLGRRISGGTSCLIVGIIIKL